jgi:hypothetical protein
MATVELDDHSQSGVFARHREGTEPVPECRWVFEPVTTRPRESDRDIGRIVQIDAWIGPLTQRDGALEDLPRLATRTRATAVDEDAGARAGGAEPSCPLGQDPARVGLEPVGGLRQGRPACAGGAEHENECADLRDPHGGTLARTDTELRRLTHGDGNVMCRSRDVSTR